MALVKCFECTREVSDKASACPHCGCPLTGRPAEPSAATTPPIASLPTPGNAKPKPAVGGCVVVFLLLVIGFLVFTTSGREFFSVAILGRDPSRGESSAAAPDPGAPSPAFTLNANDLFAEYRANEVAADAKYKGRVVVVSGTIHDIGKDLLGSAYVVLGGSGMLDGVQCLFPKNGESSVARLNKGQAAKVKGEVSGKMGNVLVKDCVLQ